jgi:hypothetical protein
VGDGFTWLVLLQRGSVTSSSRRVVAPWGSDLVDEHEFVASLCVALEITDERAVGVGYAEQIQDAG